MTKVYSIKSLSKGIVELEADKVEDIEPGDGRPYAHCRYELQRLGSECFLTYEEAREAIIEKLNRKILSLAKQERKAAAMRHKYATEAREQEGR